MYGMQTTQWIWQDKKFVAWKDACVPIMSHSMHHGTAVFEGVRFYETPQGILLFRVNTHVARLLYSANVLGMNVAYSAKEIIDAIKETIKKNNLRSGYVRPLIFFGDEFIDIVPLKNSVHLAIAVFGWDFLCREPISVKISSFARISSSATDLAAKISGHYVNSMLAGREAKRAGFDEAILLDGRGFVSEGTAENVFLVKNNILLTPQKETILPGITRDAVLEIAFDYGIRALQKNISVDEFKSADEAFLCGTAAEIIPIKKIDEVTLPHAAGPITGKIKNIFSEITLGKNEKYRKWLTRV